jgi:hypothetical protein
MTEQKQNISPKDNDGTSEQPDDEFVLHDAVPVCPKCLKPCHPLQYYCDNCDSNAAINPLTPYIGFVNIRFNYGGFCTMWRKIWYDKDTSIKLKWLYLFMIVAFAPIIVIVGLPLLLIGKIKRARLQKTITTAFYILLIVSLTAYLLYLSSTASRPAFSPPSVFFLRF